MHPGGGSSPYRLSRLIEEMAPVDEPQRVVVRRLHTILHHHIFPLGQLGEVVQQIVRHAVGTRAKDQSIHKRVGESLLVFGDETGSLSVRVRVRLEIGQIAHGLIFSAKKGDALFDLLGDAMRREAIIRVERTVVTIRASSRRDGSVAVWTREPSIDGNLLHFMGEKFHQIS